MAVQGAEPAAPGRSKLFSALIGVASALILLQGVWAGIFIREGEDNNDSWVHVHAAGGYLALLFALAGMIVALVRLRERRDLMIGSVVFVVLLLIEGFLGGLISSAPGVEAVHFPLAMALMALSVWLPTRSRQGGGA